MARKPQLKNKTPLALDISLGKRTDTVQESSFARINPAISGALTTPDAPASQDMSTPGARG